MARDKWLHAAAGLIIALVVLLLTGIPVVAFAAALFAGIGKELWDARGHGTPDVWDIAATAAPGLLLWLVVGELVVAPAGAGFA